MRLPVRQAAFYPHRKFGEYDAKTNFAYHERSATVLRALRVLILCAEHATSLGHAEIANTTFRSLVCRRLAVLAAQLILGPMPEGVLDRIVERLFLVSTRSLGAIMFSLMRFAFRIGIHIELSHQTDKNFPCRSLIGRAMTIDGAFARDRAISAAGIDLN